MADENKSIKLPTPKTVTTADKMKKQGADASQFQQAFDNRKQGYQDNITGTFGSSLESQKQGLADAYQKNVTAQDQATAAGQGQYAFAKQDLGVQAGRTQAGMDRYADVRGLNRQAGSQQALSLGMGASVARGKIAQQQQLALQESQRQQELLKTDYQNRISQAVAANDYKTAAALLDDYNNQNNWLDRNAAQLASFGNFSGYEQVYGPDQARVMQQFWAGAHPELAYNTGVISAARYKQMTGRDAPDQIPAWGGYDGGGGTLNADWYTNGRPVWTAEHSGWGPSIGGGDVPVDTGGAGSDDIFVKPGG